jgi:hypothetical protein
MKKNYLLIGGAALAVWYFFLRKKTSSPVMQMPKQAAIMQPKPEPKPINPAGLNDGDYVKFGTDATVYMVFKGQKLPLTEAWWNANAWDKWDTVKFLSPAVGLELPTGNAL